MAAEHALGPMDAIPKGEGRNYAVAGIEIAVFRTHADAVFATQALCPHKSGPLADGLVGGTTLLCPLHERGYDLQTGKGLGNPDCLTCYPVRLAGDGAMFVTV